MAKGQLGNFIRYLRRTTRLLGVGELSDRQLLGRFATGRDEAAFAALVERHSPMVWSACQRVLGTGPDAEDAYQAAFLVLARKAGATWWQESVSSWLYEVAYRVAIRARRDSNRRRQHERQVPAMPEAEPQRPGNSPELRAVLDDELSRLPEKYRVPLVLCYLEGKTNEEAAQHLGWAKGTVASRLSRARDVLRGRLTRRGLALSAAIFASALKESAAPAAPPQVLLNSTIKAGMLFAAGTTLAATVSGPAVTLAEGVLKTMSLSKLKIAVVLLLSLVIVSSAVGMFASAWMVKSPPANVAPEAVESAKDGLKLTLSANPAQTFMRKDGKNADPVELKLAFGNVGTDPIKLDGYQLQRNHLKFEVTGPDANSVRIDLNGRAMFAPLPAKQSDYHDIKAGGERVDTQTFPFGSGLIPPSYYLLKPGDYRIKVTYSNPKVAANPFAAGSWTGEIASNVIVLKVLPAKE